MGDPQRIDSRGQTSGYFICLLVTALFFVVFFLTQMVAHTKTLKVVVMTDAVGLGDRSFNDACWQGVEKAKKDFGLKTQFLQCREQADYVANLTLAARHSDVVISLGYLFVDAGQQVVPHFPGTRFVHVEGDISGENVASFDFRSEEGGFLAGLVAGLFTKTMKVGVVCGMDIPPVEAYVSGFKAGVETAQKHRREALDSIVLYVGSFNDPAKGKSLANTLLGKGVDVIFRVAGNSGTGVLEAVKDAQNAYLIAEDVDQDGELPGKILTSTIKRMDVAVYEALQDIVQRNFQSGHYLLGAHEGAIDITEMKYSKDLFSPDSLKTIQRVRALLKDGKLTIPDRYSQVENFQVPDL